MTIELIGCRLWTPKSGHFIHPASAFDEEKLATVREGAAVHLTIGTAPPAKLRQFYWGLITRLVQGGVWTHRDAAHLDLMVKAGRVEKMVIKHTADGDLSVRFEPTSTAGWCGPEWRAYLDDALPIITREFIPKVRWPSVRQDVERYVGIRLAEALQEAA